MVNEQVKGSVPLRRAWPELGDWVPVIIVHVIKGIKSIRYTKDDLQLLCEKNPTLFPMFFL